MERSVRVQDVFRKDFQEFGCFFGFYIYILYARWVLRLDIDYVVYFFLVVYKSSFVYVFLFVLIFLVQFGFVVYWQIGDGIYFQI